MQALRDYQADALASVQREWADGKTDTLLVMATGGGKTQTYLMLLHEERAKAQAAGLPFRAIVIAHTKELVHQPVERARLMGVDLGVMGVVQAEWDEVHADTICATVQSLTAQRLERILTHGAITHLVIDECHHAVAAGYLRVLNRLREVNPALLHVGVTATPQRADERGLIEVYQSTAIKIDVDELIKRRFLTKVEIYGVKVKGSLRGVGRGSNGDYSKGDLAREIDVPANRKIILDSYQTRCEGRQAIAFTPTVEAAQHLAEAANERGIAAAWVAGETPPAERERILSAYKRKEIMLLCNCAVLTEGFDAPNTSAILMCRPTKSISLYKQCIGRGLRPSHGIASDEEKCIVLDFIPSTEGRELILAGDALGLSKPLKEAAEQLAEGLESDEEGTAYQYSFDGETFKFVEDIRVIVEQLDYLTKRTTLAWYPPEGVRKPSDVLTLGLGDHTDGHSRILAIRGGVLYGLRRLARTFDPWRVVQLATEDIYAAAERYAETYGVAVLNQRGTRWRTELATDGQLKYLKRLAKGELKKSQYDNMTKGDAAMLITHYQALEALESVQEVVA